MTRDELEPLVGRRVVAVVTEPYRDGNERLVGELLRLDDQLMWVEVDDPAGWRHGVPYEFVHTCRPR